MTIKKKKGGEQSGLNLKKAGKILQKKADESLGNREDLEIGLSPEEAGDFVEANNDNGELGVVDNGEVVDAVEKDVNEFAKSKGWTDDQIDKTKTSIWGDKKQVMNSDDANDFQGKRNFQQVLKSAGSWDEKRKADNERRLEQPAWQDSKWEALQRSGGGRSLQGTKSLESDRGRLARAIRKGRRLGIKTDTIFRGGKDAVESILGSGGIKSKEGRDEEERVGDELRKRKRDELNNRRKKRDSYGDGGTGAVTDGNAEQPTTPNPTASTAGKILDRSAADVARVGRNPNKNEWVNLFEEGKQKFGEGWFGRNSI